MNYTTEQLFFQRVLKVLVWIAEKAYGQEIPIIGEIKVNYIVKDDNPDVGVQVSVGDVTDSEGQAIPDAQVTVEITSTDGNVLGVTDNGDKTGSVHFGSPGQASVQYSAKDANGNVLASGSDGFTVTTGDPAAISSISASFAGLTPVDEPPAA